MLFCVILTLTALADMHDRLKPYYSEIGRPPGCCALRF